MSRSTSKNAIPADLPRPALLQAQTLCDKAGERLTQARLNAYTELVVQGRALSAYELLALLEKRENRKLAPLSVYRRLDFLTRVGLEHRLASAQAFLACDHPDHPHDAMYLVCSTCGHADEVESTSLSRLLDKAANSRHFTSSRQVVELEGTCENCAGTSEESQDSDRSQA